MRKISSIKVSNFKAFQQEQIFDLKGKHILAYGNNGSGKSSLFWELYTLAQSSIKEDPQIQKYFRYFSESDKETYQSLRNVFTDANEDSFIELTTVDEHCITETSRRDFEKLFVNKTLPLDLINKLKINFSEDNSLTADEKDKLTELRDAISGVQKLKEYLEADMITLNCSMSDEI